jgi:hypothetical protein
MMWFKSIAFVSLVGISSLLLVVCSDRADSLESGTIKEPAIMNIYDPDQSISSDDAVVSSNIMTTSFEIMTIEGTIEQVMESWPLQLTVITNSGRCYVSLQSETATTQQGKTVAQATLKPGSQVQITGQRASTNNMTLVAQAIQIQ